MSFVLQLAKVRFAGPEGARDYPTRILSTSSPVRIHSCGARREDGSLGTDIAVERLGPRAASAVTVSWNAYDHTNDPLFRHDERYDLSKAIVVGRTLVIHASIAAPFGVEMSRLERLTCQATSVAFN